MMDQGRNAKRYATSQQLLVGCDSWGEFVALYAGDVSQGGMFIITPTPPPVLSEVDVHMSLPEGHEIRLKGRVVHVIDAETAAQAQRDPGVGIEFIALEPAMRAQIHQLIEFARWQGTSHRPTATLASHMFEMNAPTSPAQVMSSLPPDHEHARAHPSAEPSSAEGGKTSSSGVRRASSIPKRSTEPAAAAQKGSSKPPRRQSSSSVVAVNPALETPAAPAAPPPPKPTDQVELKVGMTHLARKRFAEATKHWNEMLKANPGDLEVSKWLFITEARKALAQNNETGAKAFYERTLQVDESNLEARKFVRELDQRKKMEALPFGRFFVKKKP